MEQAVAFRKELQEGSKQAFSADQIMARHSDMSEHDYVIKLALGLLEECSKNLKVPNLIARIILNNLAIKVADGLLILTEEHKLWAKQKLISCRADLINDFVAKFELKGIVGE